MGKNHYYATLPIHDDTIWSIDGDLFAVRLPSIYHLIKLGSIMLDPGFQFPLLQPLTQYCLFADKRFEVGLVQCRLHNHALQKSLVWMYLGHWEEDIFVGLSSQQIHIYKRSEDLSEPSVYWEDSETRLPWRPMLVPLNRLGEPDPSIAKDNPTGTIVSGGSFYKGDSLITKSYLQHRHIFGSPSIRDTDSEKPIRWVWIDGCLVCLNVLADVSIAELSENGLLFSKYLRD